MLFPFFGFSLLRSFLREPYTEIYCQFPKIFCDFWMRLSTLSKHAFLLYDLLVCKALSKVFEVSTFGLHVYWEP